MQDYIIIRGPDADVLYYFQFHNSWTNGLFASCTGSAALSSCQAVSAPPPRRAPTSSVRQVSLAKLSEYVNNLDRAWIEIEITMSIGQRMCLRGRFTRRRKVVVPTTPGWRRKLDDIGVEGHYCK